MWIEPTSYSAAKLGTTDSCARRNAPTPMGTEMIVRAVSVMRLLLLVCLKGCPPTVPRQQIGGGTSNQCPLYPQSGHRNSVVECPLCAKSRRSRPGFHYSGKRVAGPSASPLVLLEHMSLKASTICSL